MIPLADRLRPKSLKEIVGQKHLLAKDKLLSQSIKNGQLFSMILWGPPGVGKTTLARVVASEIEAEFMEFSAVTTGIAELKKIFEKLTVGHSEHSEESQTRSFASAQDDKQVVVFIDEIHRFNKAQQDALLPYVENGTFILIGATTENPSFEVIGPLLSRTRVLTLKALENEDLKEIINRALKDKEKGLGEFKAKIKKEAADFLIDMSSGDARIVLNTLEIAVNLSSHLPGVNVVHLEGVQEALQKKALMYDKSGEEHYNTISSYIKSMRASNVDAALYYLARMVEAGEDSLFIARRMVVFASEDVASPTALVVANAVFQACQQIGYPECQENLAAGTVYMAQAKKDRSAYEAYMKALEDVKKYGNLPIPLNLRNPSTKLMKELDYGKGYEQYSKEDLLPEKLKGKKYYTKS